MKRGFLNNKKGKAKSLGDDGVSKAGSAGMPAPSSIQSSTNANAFSCTVFGLRASAITSEYFIL